MWRLRLTLVFISCVAVPVAPEITVECEEHYGFPHRSDKSPSELLDLKVTVLRREEDYYLLNISWAVRIDASITYLTGTRLMIDGEPTYLCKYKPNLAEAKLSVSKQWFHYKVWTEYGELLVQASNLPLPPLGSNSSNLFVSVSLPYLKPNTPEPVLVPTTPDSEAVPTTPPWTPEHVTVAIFGALAGLLMMSFCYIIYKNCASFAKLLGFKSLTSAMVPVPVLMVYSAENAAFQQAVVALAEFLQWHGGCSVAIDMWQQGKIAELGPMRWLVEHIEAADRVLIVCPQSAPTNRSPSNTSFLQPSIPAATHDLYSLILNIVASHATNSRRLAKFWVVQLGEHQGKSKLPLQLRVCRTFYLTRSLNSLYRSLHSQRQDNKILDVLFKPKIPYSESSTVVLREAVNKLTRPQPNIPSEVEPLKSVMFLKS